MLRRLAPALFALLLAPNALADAVPPPPDDCPSGTVPITDHGGPRCEKEAPKNCPSGWRGVLGGGCELHQCNTDADCAESGRVCKPASLCFEPFERTTNCQNEHLTQGNAVAAPPSVLGAPCMRLDEPVTEWNAVNVCGGTEKCASPSECRPGKLCVERDKPAPKVMPRDESGQVQTKPSGCGNGCVTAPERGGSGVALLATGLLGLIALARRQR